MSNLTNAALGSALTSLASTRLTLEHDLSPMMAVAGPVRLVEQVFETIAFETEAFRRSVYFALSDLGYFTAVYVGESDCGRARKRIQEAISDPDRPTPNAVVAIGLGAAFPREQVRLVEMATLQTLARTGVCVLNRTGSWSEDDQVQMPAEARSAAGLIPSILAALAAGMRSGETETEKGNDRSAAVQHLRVLGLRAVLKTIHGKFFLMPGSELSADYTSSLDRSVKSLRRSLRELEVAVAHPTRTDAWVLAAPVQCWSRAVAARVVAGRHISDDSWMSGDPDAHAPLMR